MLSQAEKCFNEALHKADNDEPWLQHYMLGKIAEKMCKPPEEYLESYLKVKNETWVLLQERVKGGFVLLNGCSTIYFLIEWLRLLLLHAQALEELDKDDAEYPRKIGYHNPPNLALEALEVNITIQYNLISTLRDIFTFQETWRNSNLNPFVVLP